MLVPKLKRILLFWGALFLAASAGAQTPIPDPNAANNFTCSAGGAPTTLDYYGCRIAGIQYIENESKLLGHACTFDTGPDIVTGSNGTYGFQWQATNGHWCSLSSGLKYAFPAHLGQTQNGAPLICPGGSTSNGADPPQCSCPSGTTWNAQNYYCSDTTAGTPILVALNAPDWQYFPPSVAPSTNGTSFTVMAAVLPTDSTSTYKLLVSDSQINNFSTGYTWTEVSAVQFKDSNGNNICTAAGSSNVSVTIGTNTFPEYHWEQDCSAGTLTNNVLVTATITGKSFCGGTPCATTSAQVGIKAVRQ